MTFLLAGHETTAVLLTWTVYVLTKHPEYQERARQEVSPRKVSFWVCRTEATEALTFVTVGVCIRGTIC
jgi:cytochrome P450